MLLETRNLIRRCQGAREVSKVGRPSGTCWDPPAGRPSFFSETQSQPGLEKLWHPKARKGLRVSRKIQRKLSHPTLHCFCRKAGTKSTASTPVREKQGGAPHTWVLVPTLHLPGRQVAHSPGTSPFCPGPEPTSL